MRNAICCWCWHWLSPCAPLGGLSLHPFLRHFSSPSESRFLHHLAALFPGQKLCRWRLHLGDVGFVPLTLAYFSCFPQILFPGQIRQQSAGISLTSLWLTEFSSCSTLQQEFTVQTSQLYLGAFSRHEQVDVLSIPLGRRHIEHEQAHHSHFRGQAPSLPYRYWHQHPAQHSRHCRAEAALVAVGNPVGGTQWVVMPGAERLPTACCSHVACAIDLKQAQISILITPV